MTQPRACPICEYPYARRVRTATDRIFQTTQEPFELFGCPSCRLIFMDEEEVRDRLADFYPSGYWWTDAGSGGKLERKYREWMVRHDQLAFVQKALGSSFSGRLLDIGCGSGTFVKVARQAGIDATGLEMAGEAAQLAEREVPGNIFHGSEEELVKNAEQYDAIAMFHTLEHVPQPFHYLRRLKKLFRSPGTLIIQVPNCASLQARLMGGRWYGLDCPRHLYNYSTFSVLHLLGRAGYRIRMTEQFSLRDNACCMVSSLFPGLDPMASRVRARARNGKRSPLLQIGSNAVYLSFMLMAQPLARLESMLGRGGSIFIAASLD